MSDALDDSDVMGSQPYTLEVSTPGTDRVLTEPMHFRRTVGRLVEMTKGDGTQVTGRVLATTADATAMEETGADVRAPRAAAEGVGIMAM